MIDPSTRIDHSSHPWKKANSMAFCVAVMLFAGVVATAPAAAGPKEQPATTDHGQYQVYIDGRGSSSTELTKDWGSLRLTEPDNADTWRSPALSGNTGVTYFTPSLSGVRVGVGMAASPSSRNQTPIATRSTQYTDFGPRTGRGGNGAGNWQVGGEVGYAGLKVGATIGDHTDPSCVNGGTCKTNDFWDIGVALRIGPGAISAAYTASQPRGQRTDDINRVDVFSLNAGYRVAPGMDIYGGVDWVDLNSTADAAATPMDARFMLGTNLRF